MKNFYGRPPIIYSKIDFYNKYLKDQFIECPVWISDIFYKPKLSNHKSWVFWQFAIRGQMKGIKGYVDLNVFNGSYVRFQELLNGNELSDL